MCKPLKIDRKCVKAQEKSISDILLSSSLITKLVIINGKLFHGSIWCIRGAEHRIFNSATGLKLAVSLTLGQNPHPPPPPREAPQKIQNKKKNYKRIWGLSGGGGGGGDFARV
jgi:hypothetical protein